MKNVNEKTGRRKFLKNSGMLLTVSAAGSLASMAIAQKVSANDIINIGILGTGQRGTGLASVLQKMPEYKLVAGCDILPDRLEKCLSYADKDAKGYKNYRKLLNNKSVDAVIISSPLSLHHEMVMAAVDSGKHIFCEKTMAYDYEETKSIRNKVEDFKGVFQVGHQYRSTPMYHKVKELLSNGRLGKVKYFRCQYHRNNNWRRPVDDPKNEKVINWRMYREFSKGLTAELCSHQIDIVNWMLDSVPTKVTGFGGIDYWQDGRETYDNVNLIYEYPDGVKANFTSVLSNAYDGYKITIMGDQGTIVIGRDEAWLYAEAVAMKNNKGMEKGIVDGVSGATIKNWTQGKPVPIYFDDGGLDPTAHALNDFAANVKGNTNPFSNVETGKNAAIAVHMGIEAMDNGEVIHWKDRGV